MDTSPAETPQPETTETLSNAFVYVTYRPNDRSIFVRDLTDLHNEPASTTMTKRGVPKAWKSIQAAFTPQTKHRDVDALLREAGIRVHSWCMMD